jgi:hypothetical protein
MSPKKRILRELALAHEPGTTFSFIRPADIPGYAEKPERFQGAVNERSWWRWGWGWRARVGGLTRPDSGLRLV